MKSKVVFVVLGALLIIGAVVGFLVTKRNPNQELVSPSQPESEQLSKPQTPKAEFLTWNDPAGFTFKYPKGLFSNKHDEDNVNYAHIDLLPEGKMGGILILASDSQYKNLDEWTKEDKELVGGNVLDATLGGKPAKKVLSADGETITIGAIDEAILFKIQATAYSNQTIKGIFDQIVSSFAFVYPTPAAGQNSPASSGSSGGDVIEEEEVVE